MLFLYIFLIKKHSSLFCCFLWVFLSILFFVFLFFSSTQRFKIFPFTEHNFSFSHKWNIFMLFFKIMKSLCFMDFHKFSLDKRKTLNLLINFCSIFFFESLGTFLLLFLYCAILKLKNFFFLCHLQS